MYEDIPPCTVKNFLNATLVFLKLWITEQTLHRIYKWYVAMLAYIAEQTSYELLSMVEGTEGNSANEESSFIVNSDKI